MTTHPLMDTSEPKKSSPVILFDGVCNLCNQSVQFIIRHDRRAQFHFAALQSAFGIAQLLHFGIAPGMLNSVIVIRHGKAYQKSTAALEIAKDLSGLWPALYIFKIVPRFIRDGVYDLIAKNRYKLFGRRDECMIPTPELKSRFLI
jgi:predicted DCC family thiol-disulfide oxidoreductase YuxK